MSSAPKYDLSLAVGYEHAPVPVAWTTRELLLYAIGIGATSKDFPIAYELDKNFAAFPTFPVILAFKGESPDVIDFNKSITSVEVPGLPQFNPARIVHGSQSVEVIKRIPIVSGKGWSLKSRIVGVHENKSGVVVDSETLLVDPKGETYTRMLSSTFNVGGKANGTKFDKVLTTAIQPSKPIPKDRAPDYVIQDVISDNQAVLYRLSGDYNPLHVDPSIGAKAGFGGVILHGLCTYGFVARAVLREVCGGNPNGLKAISSRFTSPIKLGDKIETRAWELGPGPDGTVELGFVMVNLTTGKPALGPGVMHVWKSPKSKL